MTCSACTDWNLPRSLYLMHIVECWIWELIIEGWLRMYNELLSTIGAFNK
jgi:hypothetical protein